MMIRIAIILGLSLVICWGFAPRAVAQLSNERGPTSPEKFDEFGSLSHCSVTGRLDNVAITLQQTKDVTIHVVAYAPPGDNVGSGNQILSIIKDYLINSRGIDPERIKTAYAGRNSDLTEPRIQLWIVPENTAVFEPEKIENNEIATFKGMFFERTSYDGLNFWYYTEGEGGGIGRSIHASFADMLNQQKNAVAYVVAYNGEESIPGAWRRAADEEVETFKKHDIDPGRFKIIFGGTQREAKLQLWLLPKDAPPPLREVGRELPPKKALELGMLGADELGDKEFEARSYNSLLQVLQAGKSGRAFVAVYLDAPPVKEDEATEPETTETVAPVQDEDEEPTEKSEPADLTKLVEKWRLDLTTTHKFRNDRLIFIFFPGNETRSNELKIWYVPKGQPLPDPNKEDEEEKPEEEEDPGPPAKAN